MLLDAERGRSEEVQRVMGKIKQRTTAELRTHTQICERHRYKPKADRYSRLADLSDELDMFEIRVDPHNKARIHGVLVGSVFHLV